MDSKFSKLPQSEEEAVAISFPPREKWRIWKNVLVLGFAFMIHFTAFWGASNLQSSVNADDALGTFTLASIYGSLLVSNIFLPAVVIKWLKCKWTVAISFVTYMPFIISQFYPKFYTMIPSGLLVGLGGAPLWCAKCTYLTIIAETYAQLAGVSSDIVVTRFFGVFFMFYQFSQVWGNLISSAILSSGVGDILNTTEVNVLNASKSINISEAFLSYENDTTTLRSLMLDRSVHLCGADFCPGLPAEENPNLAHPSTSKINLISGIYLGCMIAACLIVAFGVDSLSRYQKKKNEKKSSPSGCKLLAVTVKHMANPYQILILPITMFIGAEQAFIAADFNAAFVSCGWGISNIGFVMICFGVSNAIAALIIGGIVKITGRSPVIAFALALHVALIVALLTWKPDDVNKIVYFIITGLWGVCDAVWLVQINSMYGIIFPGKEEAAYSNFRLWESTGSVITYIYSPYLCISVKLYLLLGLLIIGICGYTSVTYKEAKAKRSNLDLTDTKKFEKVKSMEIPE